MLHSQKITTGVFCEGGTLASIGDPLEQEFILNNIKIFQDTYTSFWLGLFKTNKGNEHHKKAVLKEKLSKNGFSMFYKRHLLCLSSAL